MRSMILAGSLLLALSSSGCLAAQIYRWVDAQGVTHFGAQPPHGQAAKALSTSAPAPAPAAVAPTENQPTVSGEAEQRDIDRQVRREVAEREAETQRYCTTLRTNLAQLESNPRVRIEEQGEVRRLTEEERQARIGDTKNKITENCE